MRRSHRTRRASSDEHTDQQQRHRADCPGHRAHRAAIRGLLGRRGSALRFEQPAALRHRTHRIGPRSAGRRPQPKRFARPRPHADQHGLVARPFGSRHLRRRPVRPVHQHPCGRLDPRRQLAATGLHVGGRRRLQRREPPAEAGLRGACVPPGRCNQCTYRARLASRWIHPTTSHGERAVAAAHARSHLQTATSPQERTTP